MAETTQQKTDSKSTAPKGGSQGKTPFRGRRPGGFRDGNNKGPGGNAKRGGRNDRRPGRGGRRGGRPERARPEFDQKIISIRRVTRVSAGGRRFSFSVAIVAGNRNGKVGVGSGKATDTALAIEKAFKDAKKNMVVIKRNKKKSIVHDVQSTYCASTVTLRPSPGRGIVAGSSVRTVLELAGVTDVISKIQTRSKNRINNARATIDALKMLDS